MEFMVEDLAVSMLLAADIFRQIHYKCAFSVEENVAVSTDIFGQIHYTCAFAVEKVAVSTDIFGQIHYTCAFAVENIAEKMLPASLVTSQTLGGVELRNVLRMVLVSQASEDWLRSAVLHRGCSMARAIVNILRSCQWRSL